MKKVILLCGALLAVSASLAQAQGGINLAWGNCASDGGTLNKAFACGVNTGSNTAVGSFLPPVDILQVSGNEVVIDLQSASATLDPWWQFKNAGTCRTTALAANFVLPATASNCLDQWNGQASGGIGAYNIGFNGNTNRARIVMAIALPPDGLGQDAAGSEWFSFNLVINNTKTTGTGSCAGCSSAVCLVLNSINVTEPVGVGDYKITAPGTANFVTWQGGVISNGGCPAATPTHNTTWGSVKALYR